MLFPSRKRLIHKKWDWVVCKVDTIRRSWLLTLSLGLESILDPGLCGDNHPLITVIYLLVGQDNSCSAGDVDLREKERQREERKWGEKWDDNWRLVMKTNLWFLFIHSKKWDTEAFGGALMIRSDRSSQSRSTWWINEEEGEKGRGKRQDSEEEDMGCI